MGKLATNFQFLLMLILANLQKYNLKTMHLHLQGPYQDSRSLKKTDPDSHMKNISRFNFCPLPQIKSRFQTNSLDLSQSEFSAETQDQLCLGLQAHSQKLNIILPFAYFLSPGPCAEPSILQIHHGFYHHYYSGRCTGGLCHSCAHTNAPAHSTFTPRFTNHCFFFCISMRKTTNLDPKKIQNWGFLVTSSMEIL